MNCIVLFFLLILTTTQTTSLHHHCNSDVYSSASGMADLQQLTTLQYCLIDNCTIMRIDTGQQLDIIYTTQSHLVVIPTDGQTSMIIFKNNPELFCSTSIPSGDFSIIPVIGLILLLLLALVSGYVAVVHVMFKETRSTFGKLMMLYNIFVVCLSFALSGILITHRYTTVSSMVPCYLLTFLFILFGVVSEALATSFIAYLAYIMHQSYKSIPVNEEMNKKFYKSAIMYVSGFSILFVIFVVSYDFGTGTYKYTLLPNGHCATLVQSEYNTKGLYQAYLYLNKTIQISLLVVYFVYHYRLNKKLKMVRGMANIDTKQNGLFLKIAITMTTTIGISHILYASSWYYDSVLILRTSTLFFVIQQCVIMLLFIYSKKIRLLCKERFCTATKIYPQISP